MNCIEKFISDVEKIKKHYRANHASYDGQAVAEEVAALFEGQVRDAKGLLSSFADYWLKTYVLPSASLEDQPSAENILRLSAMLSLFQEDFSDEDAALLSASDWKALCQLTDYEADDLPLDLLNRLMMIFVEKQALN